MLDSTALKDQELALTQDALNKAKTKLRQVIYLEIRKYQHFSRNKEDYVRWAGPACYASTRALLKYGADSYLLSSDEVTDWLDSLYSAKLLLGTLERYEPKHAEQVKEYNRIGAVSAKMLLPLVGSYAVDDFAKQIIAQTICSPPEARESHWSWLNPLRWLEACLNKGA